MTAAAPPIEAPTEERRAPTLSAHPLAFALLVVAVLTGARLAGTVDSDVAWQLWVAGRLHAGATLYRDIIEVNPPLWFWMAVPVERLAALFHLRIEAVAIAATSGAAALSLAATDRLLAYLPTRRRRIWLCYTALILVAMPWMHTGQREQIALIAALPYIALTAARHQSRQVTGSLAALIGIGAGLGFALKHYFVLVPALLELWLFITLKRRWTLVRPETTTLAFVGLIYAVAILLFAPEYLTEVVPFVRLFYGGLTASSLEVMLGPFAIILVLILAATALQFRMLGRKAPMSTALFIAALGFGASYLLQFKGWPYHTLPALGCASLSLAGLLAEQSRPPRVLRLAAPALLTLPLVLAAQEQWTQPLPTPELDQAVAGLEAGDSVGFIATEAAVPWSVTLQRGFRYPSRYIGFWTVIAANANARSAHPDPSIEAGWRNVVQQTITDFRCAPPKRIIVARPAPGDTENFDILPMFTSDANFRALLSHYHPVSRTTFETYEQVHQLPPLPRSACRTGV